MPNKNMLGTYPRLRKDGEHLFWILHKIMEIAFFSANVRQCNIVFRVVHVLVCFKSFFIFLPAH